MPDQKSMDDARKWNADIDAALKSVGIVDESLYLRLLDAYGYDAASTVGWVEAKMRVLLDRVRQGKELSLFAPSLREQKSARTELELRTWVGQHFPGLSV